MATTKLAAPLSGLRGTVGGWTFSANGAGTYAKLWSPPSQPRSPLQQAQRGNLSQLPNEWRALTDAQRTAWNTWAALPAQAQTNSLGDTYYLNGFQWFVKCNTRLMRSGRATIATYPTGSYPAAPASAAITVTPAGSETDRCTGGTPTASSEQPAHPASHAFDNSFATWWQTQVGVTAATLEYQFAATQVIRRYDLYILNYTYWENPDDWTFESYNGATWDVLHTVTNWQVSSNGWHSFYFPNSTTSTRYRLNITGVRSGSGTSIILYEAAMFNGALGSSVLTYPQYTFTLTPRDCILHCSITPTQSRSVQYPGFYEVLATQTPGDFYTLIQDELTAVFGTIQEGRRYFARCYRQTSEGLRGPETASYADVIE